MFKLGNILTTVTKITGRSGLILQKYSPEILLFTGLTGVVGAGVLACRATLRAEDVLAIHRENIEKIDEAWELAQDETITDISTDTYTDNQHKKDLTVQYAQTTVNFIKLYGPAITLGAVSIACILGSYRIMSKRNVALMAAYKAIEEGFAAYRKRVIGEHGERADYMYKNGLRETDVIEPAYTDEQGVKHKAQTTKKLVEDPNGISIYAKFFDETNPQWGQDPQFNFFFLRAQQNYFNDLLKVRGHVFLNEVYEALGFEHTQAGAVVGWIISKDGDNFVDFGIFDGNNPKARDFVNGYEKSILLDFNVDGTIWDKI